MTVTLSAGLRKIAVLVLIGLASHSAVGCTNCSSEFITFPTGEQALYVDRSLLTDDGCTPPCWYGIVPGESTPEDVVDILWGLEFVDTESIARLRADCLLEQDCIEWRTSLSDWSYYLGKAYFGNGGVVSRIQITIEYQLTVQELLDRFGPPDKAYIQPMARGKCFFAEMLWLDKGLLVNLELSSTQTIERDQRVVSAIYFMPASTVEKYLLSLGLPEDEANHQAESYVDWDQLATPDSP